MSAQDQEKELTQADFDETVETAFRVAAATGATLRGAAGYISSVLQDERKRERQKLRAALLSLQDENTRLQRAHLAAVSFLEESRGELKTAEAALAALREEQAFKLAAVTRIEQEGYIQHKPECSARFCVMCGDTKAGHMMFGSDTFVEQACTCGLADALQQAVK